MSILSSTSINGDTLALKGKVKWSYTDGGTNKTIISNMSNIGIEENPYTMGNYSFEGIIKFPVAGTYTFTYQTSGLGSVFMSSLSETMTTSLPQSSTFFKGQSRADSKPVITITTTGDNTLMKIMLVTSQYYNYFYGSTGPAQGWDINNFCYCLCDNNSGCVPLIPLVSASNSLLNSSSCLTINGNTLVSKGNVKYIGTNTDGSKTVWYDKISSQTVNSGKYFTNFTGEALLKFPSPGKYTFSVLHAPGAQVYMSAVNEILNNISAYQVANVAGRSSGSFSVTTTVNDEIKKILITGNTAGGPNITFVSGPVTLTDVNDIVYCFCDDNTLNNCTYLMPNNVVVIKGMVKNAMYKDRAKNYTDFSSMPMPDPTKSTLVSQSYTSSLNILQSDVTAYTTTTGTTVLTSVTSGYITFPKTEVYYWSVGCDDHTMILFGSPTMSIDMFKTPTTDSIIYSTPIGSNPTINRPMQAEAGKMYRFVIIFHNSGGPGTCTVKIKEGSQSAAEMSIPLSWISSDFTLDYADAYRSTISSKCGTSDSAWSTVSGCSDIFNDNIANILQAKNINGKKYADLVIAQCSSSNTGTIPATCSSVFNFNSKDSSIINAYCNDNNRFILDDNCRNYAVQNPNINDWANKQMNYCTSSYANLTSAPCVAYYTAKNNKPDVYGKFCTDTNGSKMLASKTTATDCLTNDTKNFDTNVALIKSTCNSSNTTLFGGFCNDMAPDTRFNDSITSARLNSCTDAAIDADLTTKTSCVPYLADPSRISKVDTRVVSYCENGSNRYSNALCSQFYGTDGTPITKNSDAVIQKSIDYKLYNQCVANNKFATDTTCSNIVLGDINSYASQVTNYCNNSANIGSAFCKSAYKTLIDATKTTCTAPTNVSSFMNKESFVLSKSLVETLNGMKDYDYSDLHDVCNYIDDNENNNYDMKTIFMIIIAFIIISLLISLLINKIKSKKSTETNEAQSPDTNIIK